MNTETISVIAVVAVTLLWLYELSKNKIKDAYLDLLSRDLLEANIKIIELETELEDARFDPSKD